MHIFEYSQLILIVLCVLVLGTLGVRFAFRAIKEVNDTALLGFVSLGKLKALFSRMGREGKNRTVISLNISFDSARNLNSESRIDTIESFVEPCILKVFSEKGEVTEYDRGNYIILTEADDGEISGLTEKCREEILEELLKNGAANIADIRFGVYSSVASQIGFSEAILRAKQACTLAKEKDVLSAFWDIKNGKDLERKITIENNIEQEIDNNRFYLEYQPVIDALTKRIIGVEVLSRLNSSSHGMIMPNNFLGAVNSAGLNNKFDYYIFEKNCKWVSNDRQKRGKYLFTVNFSRNTLSDPSFAKKIIDITEKYDLSFSSVAVEILEDENVTEEARDAILKNLSDLKDKGVRILLDDFGSGYTTFTDLDSMAINTVKIDRGITQKATNEKGFLILKNIIHTAHDLGFKTVCEGVETKEQEEAAIEAGSDMLQGFYYYKPMSVTELEKVFETSRES